MATPSDESVTAFARELAALGGKQRSQVFRMSWWSDKLLDRAMANPAFKTELFRFVDVFPATSDDDDVLRHLDEYLSGDRAPRFLQAGVSVAEAVPGLGAKVAAGVARSNIRRMAEQFIVGVTPADAVQALAGLWRGGSAATVDLLGEKTVVEAEADRYADRVQAVLVALLDAAPAWPACPILERDDTTTPVPRVNVSVKPTALAPKLAPLTGERGVEQVKERLRPLLHLARDRGAFVNVDMEHLDVKDLTIRAFRELLDEDGLRSLEAGIVVQAYLKESIRDLTELIEWSARREAPITVRLVKGAYWDTETVVAQAAGWPVPVFGEKGHTDAAYERCVRLLHDHHGEVKAAFASHNLRSLAYAVVSARARGIPDHGYELQMLSGMAEPVQAAIRAAGLRLRIYAPVGELVPGMAYLVRRLLENTSNESFVRQSFAEGRALDELLRPPGAQVLPDPPADVATPSRRLTDAADPDPYDPEPTAEWRRPAPRAAMAAAVEGAVGRRPLDVPAVIRGERVRTAGTIRSVDPADPDHLVAVSASCGRSEADAAVAAAVRATDGWRRRPAADRATVLFRAAQWMADRRFELAALEVLECGKPWGEADADVCEAIDFCEYYGREAIRLERRGADGAVQSPPGERNTLTYQGKGVAVVIAPWNFPLAIPCGMVVAALVAGNPVILKPAEQAPAIAYRVVEALEAGGAPHGTIGFLPGFGEEVGAHLVAHPDVAVIAFTGSRDVGLKIIQEAAVHRPGQRALKRVVAEMGGKNPLIVDADADLDQAVPAVMASAFGFAGQKCSATSRLVVLDDVYDQVVARLAGAIAELAVGAPRHMGTQMGPVIDGDAHASISAYADLGASEGRVLIRREDVPARGWFVGPTVVTDLDPATSRLAREEVFGPVLAVFRAADLDEAIALANDTEYALTAGIVSRSPVNIARAAAELRAGNVYVNRSTTGAVVGRQPFGGYGMSGIGSKAGGPDHLLQLMDPKVTTENTLRQGFAPLDA